LICNRIPFEEDDEAYSMAPYVAGDSGKKKENPLFMRLFETDDKVPTFKET